MNKEYDLSQYEVDFDEQEAENQLATQEPENEYDLSQYEVHAPPESAIERFSKAGGGLGLRKGVQFGLSALEQVLGTSGQLNNLLMSGIEYGAEKITGEKNPRISKFAEKFRETGKTPEYFREKEKQLTGGALEPQNEEEEVVREVGQDVGAFLMPLPGMRGVNALQAMGMAVAGQTAKQGAKQFTDSESKQDITKIGAFFLTDLLMRRIAGNTANRYINQLYESERAMVPQGTRHSAAHLENEANNVLNEIRQSNVRTPSSTLVERTAEQVLSDIQNGEADVHAMLLQKRRLNEIRGDPVLHRHEEPILNRLSQAVEANIRQYGDSVMADPHFNATHIGANEAYATMVRSRGITNFVRRHIPRSASHFMWTLFGEAVTGHGAAIPATVAGVGAVYGAVKTGELTYRIMNSPTLREYYLGVLREASAENVGAMTKYMKKLEDGIKKEGLDQEPSE